MNNAPEDYILDYFTSIDDKRFLQPHKYTILHEFILDQYNEMVEYVTDKADAQDTIKDWKRLLKDYEVRYLSLEKFIKKNILTLEEDENHDYEYAMYLCDVIRVKVSKKVADETFQILFGDRMFCLTLNKIIAEHITTLKIADNPNLLAKDGIVKRCNYIPQWARRAVFMRDKGNCAICLTDLSGLLKTNFNKAIDHIVPLRLGGSNDITNFQLICQTCNNKKLGRTILTSEYYPSYFS